MKRWSWSASTAILVLMFNLGAQAQSWQTRSISFALKGGESAEISDLYWVINCKSQLIGSPVVTILDGPPNVTAEVTEAKVIPRFQQCSKPVSGGKLKLTAGKIEDESQTVMTLRIVYNTKDGPRQNSININLSLFPSD